MKVRVNMKDGVNMKVGVNMKNAFLLFSLTGATLVGAFFLTPPTIQAVPKIAKAPAVIPTVTQNQATSHLSFSDGTIEVNAQIDRSRFRVPSSDAESEFWMEVKLHAVTNPTKTTGVSTILVLDRSGSMAGAKMEAAKNAGFRLIQQLKATDQLAIVSYGTDATVDLQLMKMDLAGRQKAKQSLNRIQEGGGTNIEGGLIFALEMAKAGSRATNGRVIFLSDGRPTEGNRNWQILNRLGVAIHDEGFKVTTIGVGDDYNEDLLEKIALSGAGRYHHIQKAEKLGQIFRDELRHARRSIARNVALQLPFRLNGWTLQEVPGYSWVKKFPGALETEMHNQIQIGDMASGETRHIFAKWTRVEATSISAETFLAPAIRYADTHGKVRTLRHQSGLFHIPYEKDQATVERTIDRDIKQRIAAVKSSLAVTRSMKFFQAGKSKRAIQELETQQKVFSNLTGATEAERAPTGKMLEQRAHINELLETISEPENASQISPAYIKYQKAKAYKSRR
jgi:Ca-activated chloride channel homolog